MAKIIAVTNQKGGVGKTTTCINLCAALVNIRRRVMLIDLDPQGNATVGCGVMKNEFNAGTYEVLLGEAKVNDAIIKTDIGVDLLAANDDLAGAQIELLELPDREVRLKSFLMACQSNYDYLFIDCPPSLNILTINALAAAQSVLIPIQCEYYALEGVSALVGTIDKIKYSLNPGLKIEGLLRTMYDGRNSLAVEVSQQLISHFENKVYETVIPRNVRVAEAPGYGVSVIDYDKTSKGATAYLNLAGEFLMKQTLIDDQDDDEADDDDYDHDVSPESAPAPAQQQTQQAQASDPPASQQVDANSEHQLESNADESPPDTENQSQSEPERVNISADNDNAQAAESSQNQKPSNEHEASLEPDKNQSTTS